MSSNKWLSSRSTRREQLSQQERLIEQRKKEIESKMKDTDGENACEPSMTDTSDELITQVSPQASPQTLNAVTDHNHIQTTDANFEPNADPITDRISDRISDQPINSSDDSKPVMNKFKNDGSFFAQFMEMQKKMEKQNVELSDSKESNESKELGVVETKEERDVRRSIRMTIKSNASTENTKLKIVDSSHLSTVKFSDEDCVESKVSSPEERDVRLAIEKTAISVAMNGTEAEQNMRQTMADNPLYNWLNDKDSSFYKYFEERVEALTEAKKRAQSEGLLELNSPKLEKEENLTKAVKRERKSRWSDEVTPVQCLVSIQDPALVQYAIHVFGKTDLTADQWKQLEDQRKMKMLFDMLKAKQKKDEMLARAGKVKYEYDSDEDIEEGTWEHKRRKEEMIKTKIWATELTEKATGKHHIGDFMPPEELEKFMQKWESLKDGKSDMSPESDYKDAKLQSDNVGFKMLQKLGWVEGQGLGTNASGIAEPVNKAAAGVNNAGLGQKRPDELKEGDDEYEAYRKRMMLAYRFRPNPLNNPRRAYY